MLKVLRIIAVLAVTSLLAACFPQGRHPYTISGPTDAANQAFWTDFSSAEEQREQWRNQMRSDSRARLSNLDSYFGR